MPFAPAFEETDDLVSRVYRDPMKYAKQLAKGLFRGAVSAPFDIADLAKKATPMGFMGSEDTGPMVRALMDKAEPLKAEGTTLESAGELLSPMPPIGKAGMVGSMLIGGKRAVNIGALHPDKLADALKMFKQGVEGNEIWRRLGVHVSDPRHFKDEAIALAPIETPGLKYGDKVTGNSLYDNRDLDARLRQGTVGGFDELVKAYPEAGKTTIRDVNDPSVDAYGWFDPGDKSVSINHALISDQHPAESVLGHELTHRAVQDADGLPGGANLGMSNEVVTRVGNILNRSEGQLASAALMRQLLEQSGATRRAPFGAADIRDASKLWNASRSATRGMETPGPRAIATALRESGTDINDKYDLVLRMNQRMPPNAGVGYRNTWGEAHARRNQGALPLTVAELLKVPDLSKLDNLGALDDELFDIGEYQLSELKKRKLIY